MARVSVWDDKRKKFWKWRVAIGIVYNTVPNATKLYT